MNKLKKYFLLLISISVCTLLNSCGVIAKSIGNKYLTEEKGAIPPEFGQKGTVFLLVEDIDSNIWYRKFINSRAESEYKGSHEVVKFADLDLKKFNDVNIYRFVFLSDNKQSEYFSGVSNTNGDGFSTSESKFFYVYDRKTKKEYRSKKAASNWGKYMRIYIKKLNEKRVSQQN